MCVIINNPMGRSLNIAKLYTAYVNNPDGVGIMWHHENHVEILKARMSFNEFMELHESLQSIPHAIHFRYRTAGDTSDERCHPFPIFTRQKDGFDLYMMHNGTFDRYAGKHPIKSDTQLFAENIREGVKKWKRPLDVLHPHVLDRIGRSIGGGNKILFMGSGGLTRIVNSDRGWFETEDGPISFHTFEGTGELTWYSNKYSFIDNYRKRDHMEAREERQNAVYRR